MAEITNTTREAQENPFGTLIGALGNTDGFIEGQEAAGQRQVVASSSLPTVGPWHDLEALGFVRGEQSAYNPLFTECTLPEGWEKRGSDHAMWSYVHDERGVKRVAVFYKAAFYDQRADMHLVNVGYDLSGDIIYGDDPVVLPAQWGVLTDEEKASLADRLTKDIEKNQEYLEKYGKGEDDEPDSLESRMRVYIERSETGLKLISEANGG